jgi:hypothetical protein
MVFKQKRRKETHCFENKILRKIFGPINDNGEWRSRHNVVIRNLYRDRDLIAHARARRLRWAGRVKRREHGTLLKEVDKGQPNGRRPKESSKKRWWGSVKTDVGKVGARMDETQVRERW